MLSFFMPTLSHLSELTVKILAQKRVEPLRRLLQSLQKASYPPSVNINIEIYVDQIPALPLRPRASKDDTKRRHSVLDLVDRFVQTWRQGNAVVVRLTNWQGLRGMWLTCADPGIFGEEFTRFVILEDDVELSPAWYVATSLDMLRAVWCVGLSSSQQRRVRTP